MAELTVPQIDFSSLGNLGQLYQQGRADAMRRQTLASLGQGGAADADALLRSGDLSLAQLGISLRNRQEDQARQANLDARQAARDKVADAHWAASHELQKQAAARAAEDKYTIKEVTNPDGSTTLYRINQRGSEGPIGGLPTTGGSQNPFTEGGKFNEGQGKAAGFTDRMLQSEGVLRGFNGVPGVEGQGASMKEYAIENARTPYINVIPDVAKNALHSKDYQKFDQAKRDFINAQLRRESGAAISPTEFDSANKQYFPMPGDTDEVIKQKAANRRAAVEAMGREGGSSYRPKMIYTDDGRVVALPKVGEMRDGYRFRGGNPADPNSWAKAQ